MAHVRGDANKGGRRPDFPEGKRVRTTIGFNPVTSDKIKQIASKRGCHVSVLIDEIVTGWVNDVEENGIEAGQARLPTRADEQLRLTA